jgi:hypothetical protein
MSVSKVFGFIGWLFKLIVNAGSWIMDQLVQTGRNIVGLFAGTSLIDVAPPSVVSTVDWLLKQFPRAAALGTAEEQIKASIVLAVATFLTGAVTGGAAWAIMAVWGVTFVIGLLRLVPAADRAAKTARKPGRRAWNWLTDLLVRW